jgi:hypothetical protein
MYPNVTSSRLSNHPSERLPRPGYTSLRLPQAIGRGINAIRRLPGSAKPFVSSNARTLQWILQRRSGDQWKGLAYCRTRAALIREASGLLGRVPESLFQLPEHHDGFIEAVPRCGVCGRIATKPTGILPRHMFCIAVRKRERMPAWSGPAPLVQALGTEVPGLTSQEVSVSGWLPIQ